MRLWFRSAAATALVLLNQGAFAAAGGPVPDPTPGPLTLPGAGSGAPTLDPAPMSGATSSRPKPASAGEGRRLNLPAKSPLVLPGLGAGADLYAVKDAAVYGGLTVTWRASARLLLLEAPGDRKARLLVDDPWLYDGSTRVALPRALTLAAGAPALDEAGLRLLLQRLCAIPPVFEPADADEVAAARAAWAPAPAPAAPILAPTPGAGAGPVATTTALTAVRPLAGRRLRKVVIDAGHGGHDPGALSRSGLKEKDICLDIAQRLRDELQRSHPGLAVLLTRSDDRYLTLRQRTEFANNADADLFISVHNNASRNRNSRGSQVFFYDSQSSDRAAADLALRENEDANELEILMTDLAKSLVRDQSIGLASKVQAELGRALKLKNRDLSYAPFYVLARTKMPAILVEVAFISNAQEEALLRSPRFRQDVAASIARGVQQYRRLVEEQP